MAISLAEILLFADFVAGRLEGEIDDELHRAFSAKEPPNGITVPLWAEGIDIFTDFHRDVAESLAARYRAAGWTAR